MSKDPGSAASARAPQAPTPVVPVRPGPPRPTSGLIVLALALVGACLLAGLDAVLLRLGAWAPAGGAALAALRDPLLLVGLPGAVIALGRAAAVGETWALLAPIGCASGCLALVAGVPEPAGQVLALLGSAALCAVNARLHQRAASVAVDVRAMGAIALTLGNLLWLRGMAIATCVPLWLLLPVLAVVGEHLEPAAPGSSDVVPGTVVQEVLRAVSAAALLGACMLGVTESARLVIGPALLAMAVVMARDDVARGAIRVTGAARLAAACALTGRLWLAVAGLAWTLSPLDAGPGAGRGAYKTVAPAIVLGWVLPMMAARITTRAATAPAAGRPRTGPAAARRP